MLKLRSSALIGICVLFCASGARADSTFDLTATGTGTKISLVMIGKAVSGEPGEFDITSLSGTVDGYSATLLATSGPGVITESKGVNGWLIEFDDLLNMNGPYLDAYGLGFTLSDGALGNLYYSDGYLYAQLGNSPPSEEAVSVSVVDPPGVNAPEPGSLALLSALVAICLLVLRKHIA